MGELHLVLFTETIFDLHCAACASNRRAGLSAHPNAAITHDVDVSFQRNRGIVCLPGDA